MMTMLCVHYNMDDGEGTDNSEGDDDKDTVCEGTKMGWHARAQRQGWCARVLVRYT
jgi:hypothetical protein